jgi:hypothetical protein
MAERLECEFYLVQYVPDPVRNEFVHVGVILRDAASGSSGVGRVVAVKFTSDWRRVRCLDPDADTAYLEGLEIELRRRFEAEPEGNLMHVLRDSFSNCVQVTRPRGFLVESFDSGLEELMRLYVLPLKRERQSSRQSGRAGIQLAMRTEFERAGVWELLRKRIAVAQYTRAGDPLRIDLGYRSAGAHGLVRMFQAVSLEGGSHLGVEAAKVLAFSAAGLRAGVERVERVPLELTAVVETIRQGIERRGSGDTYPRGQRRAAGDPAREQEIERQGTGESEFDAERMEGYRFAVETMEEHGIRVVTTADLDRLAETARVEIGV